MKQDSINQQRYRTLQYALVLAAVSSLGGVLVVSRLPGVNPAEWIAFLLGAIACLALMPVAARARARNDRPALERVALITVGIGTALVIQRLLWTMYGPLIHNPAIYLFRPTFAFTPFLFLGAMAVMRARVALRFCWIVWAAMIVLTLPSLAINIGFTLERQGMTSLLVWLFLANPLFILLMHGLPHYEDALDRSTAELAEARSRNELVSRLEESEKRFNMVVEGLQVGVWDWWMDSPTRRWWSPRYYELIGYAPEDLPASGDNLQKLMHPEDRDRVRAETLKQLRHGDFLDVEYRINTKHRGFRWFHSHGRAERDANNRIIRLAGAVADIHDRRLAEDALRAAQAEMTRLAYRDTLTDLHNRRYFDEHFQREWERARRSRQPLSILIIDLDYFKAYNDRYGHRAGDNCLVELAQVLKRCASRPGDIVARLGGEEFGMLLPETSADGGEQVAQRLRQMLQTSAIPHDVAPAGVVTVSIGISAIESPDGPSTAELFEQADMALYEVKRRGRNDVMQFRNLPRAAGGSTGQTAA